MTQIAVFYCQHQAEHMRKILKELDGSPDARIRKVALPCSGKLEVGFLLKALENGADGVALFGCLEEECRYMVGSQRAGGRVRWTGKILEEVGLGTGRVHRFIFAGGPQEERLTEVRDWIGKINSLGPLNEKKGSPEARIV